MLRVSIPFTNEVVFSPDHPADNQLDEVVVNRYDEVRGAIRVNVKSYHVAEIAVYIIKLNCPESVLVSARTDKLAWLMNFTLQGQLSIHTAHTGNGLQFNTNTHCSLTPPATSVVDAVIQGEVNLFSVCLSRDCLKRLLTDDEHAKLQSQLNNAATLLNQRITTPAMHDIIDAVMHCADNNCLHRIFLAAKMLELLFLDVEQLNKTAEQSPTVMRISDLEKLKLAKELIGRDIQAPCSLIELAHKVGLNDFKLKKGFKEAFGTTVFGHLFDLRMEKAREMLTFSDYTISEVANEVGYKNAHHFTAAFKKKFGYLPSKRRI